MDMPFWLKLRLPVTWTTVSVLKIHPPAPDMEDNKAHSGYPIPEKYKEQIDLLEPQARFHFIACDIPYAIMSKMASQRFTKLEDIAERWPELTLRDRAIKDLGLDKIDGYSDDDIVFYVTRLVHVCRQAREEMATRALAARRHLSKGGNPRRPGHERSSINAHQGSTTIRAPEQQRQREHWSSI